MWNEADKLKKQQTHLKKLNTEKENEYKKLEASMDLERRQKSLEQGAAAKKSPEKEGSGPKLQLFHVLLIALLSLLVGAFTAGKKEELKVPEVVTTPDAEQVFEQIEEKQSE